MGGISTQEAKTNSSIQFWSFCHTMQRFHNPISWSGNCLLNEHFSLLQNDYTTYKLKTEIAAFVTLSSQLEGSHAATTTKKHKSANRTLYIFTTKDLKTSNLVLLKKSGNLEEEIHWLTHKTSNICSFIVILCITDCI